MQPRQVVVELLALVDRQIGINILFELIPLVIVPLVVKLPIGDLLILMSIQLACIRPY